MVLSNSLHQHTQQTLEVNFAGQSRTVRPSQTSDTATTATATIADKDSSTNEQSTSSSDEISFGEQRLSLTVTRPQRSTESLSFSLQPSGTTSSSAAATAAAAAADSTGSANNSTSSSSSEVCCGTLQLPHSEQQQQQQQQQQLVKTPERSRRGSVPETSPAAVAPRADDIVSGVREVQLTSHGGAHCGTLKVLLELAPLRLLVGGIVLQFS
jgi:hypothetical protein